MTNAGWSRRELLAAMAAGAATMTLPRRARGEQTAPGMLQVRDVMVIDGTGAPARHADVLVAEGRIVQVGRISRRAARGARIIEGGGRVLAPGFIDLHTHGDPLQRSYQPFLAMGVTTVVLGQDGGSPGAGDDGMRRLPEWMAAVEAAIHSGSRRMPSSPAPGLPPSWPSTTVVTPIARNGW